VTHVLGTPPPYVKPGIVMAAGFIYPNPLINVGYNFGKDGERLGRDGETGTSRPQGDPRIQQGGLTGRMIRPVERPYSPPSPSTLAVSPRMFARRSSAVCCGPAHGRLEGCGQRVTILSRREAFSGVEPTFPDKRLIGGDITLRCLLQAASNVAEPARQRE
jgi:hypothetical protein